jgi:hypothetical protein
LNEKSKINERINLRISMLKRLYDQHFDNDGKESKITLEPEDTEERLALSYLADKGLACCRPTKGAVEYMAKITADGIDFIEKHLLKEDEACS